MGILAERKTCGGSAGGEWTSGLCESEPVECQKVTVPPEKSYKDIELVFIK